MRGAFSDYARAAMDRFCRIVSAALLAVVLAACAGRGGDIPYDPPGFTAPDPLANKLPQLPTVLGPGDVIEVKVYRVADLSGEQVVDNTGRIKVPLIGALVAAGKTADQLETDIASALGARYLQSPDVQVMLKTPVARLITVDGSVVQPGLYPVTGQVSLLQTIAMARGTAQGANPHRVVVFRTIEGQRMAASFDIESIRDGKMDDPAIYPDDIVVVDGSSLSATWTLLIQTLPLVALFQPFR
ncbi:MAG: polysaccharide export protein [Erythrobacter sp.]|uniref:polysaccharide biosynthesis/export family protein n=1 Tax=Erythrobacter sp. TaxID=1042 RepID=UPI0025D966EA|nr:polysaccharide biosynthesis/export family protein [Erythrobacter sp.]MCL9999646.1 polysaccharide export protein [Erythrobacter sp.]